MHLHFKEKRYNWGDSFYILNDSNQRVYRVKTSVLLWNKKFQLCDLDKNVLAVIRNEPRSLLKKKFYIEINGQDTAAITREISPVPKYTIEGLDWEMRGLMLREYEMLKNGREVLSFHTELTNWGDRPVLRVANPADELLALAVVLTISYAMNAGESGEPTTHL